MARPPRRMPPSAMDGYRRLARTRSASPPPDSQPTDPTPPTAALEWRRLRIPVARAAGALRFMAFVAVLAIIIGTSVSLASGDPQERQAAVSATKPAAATAQATPARDSTVAKVAERADAPAATPVTTSTKVEPNAAEPATTSAAASAPTSTRSLPNTGDDDIARLLLAGAATMLLGMLVQIAGQPLPARSQRGVESTSSRTRLASRVT